MAKLERSVETNIDDITMLRSEITSLKDKIRSLEDKATSPSVTK
jgi:FtsZ-binding cell division protein ZapB